MIELYLMYGRGEEDPRQGRRDRGPLPRGQRHTRPLDMAGCSVTILKADDDMPQTLGMPW
jgi:dihydroxyacetone kinase